MSFNKLSNMVLVSIRDHEAPSQVILAHIASRSHCRHIQASVKECTHNCDGRSARSAHAIQLKSVFCFQFCFFDWRNSSVVRVFPQSTNFTPRCCCQRDCCKCGGNQIQQGWLPKLGDCIGAKGNPQSYHVGCLNSTSTLCVKLCVNAHHKKMLHTYGLHTQNMRKQQQLASMHHDC